MKILSSPRGVIATAETAKPLERIRDEWPEPNDRLHINDWKGREDKRNSRRSRTSER